VPDVLRATGLALVLGFSFAVSMRAAEQPPVRVERLIEQLAKADPKARAAARKALETLGPEALPALRKAVAHPDLEVRKRVAEVVASLETRVLVAPKLVSLRAEKKTARQLLDELSRQTGYKMDIWNDDQQTVFTLDLEKVPFWKAVDEIGRLSNLHPLNGYGDERLRFQKDAGHPAHICYDGAFRLVPVNFEHQRLLTFQRLGDPGKLPQRSDTLTLSYILHAEPKLPLLSAGEAMLTEALDNDGRSLTPQPQPLLPDDPQRPMMRRTSARYGNGYATTSVQGSITLGSPAYKARGVKLLRATIPVTLLAEQKPEIVANEILEVKNKKFTVGTTTFHIESCELTPEKQYRLKMSITEGQVEANDYSWMNSLYRRIELLDEKGNKYQNFGSGWSHNAPNHVQATFNYAAGGATLTPPHRLSYQVWKTLSYQVRVELHDLPLP
jgi:hypothetical protein